MAAVTAGDALHAVHDKYANGDEYRGEVVLVREPGAHEPRVLKHGVGTYRFANGAAYSGEWNCGRMHGWGEFSDGTSGDYYEGNWYNGQRDVGRYYFSNGDVYEGKFVDNLKDGRGVVWEQQRMYEVVYRRDSLVSKIPFDTQNRVLKQPCRRERVPKAAARAPRVHRSATASAASGRSSLTAQLANGLPSSRTISTAEYAAAVEVLREKLPRSPRDRDVPRGAYMMEHPATLRDRYRYYGA